MVSSSTSLLFSAKLKHFCGNFFFIKLKANRCTPTGSIWNDSCIQLVNHMFFHEAVQVFVNGLIRASPRRFTSYKNRNGGDAEDASARVSLGQSAEHKQPSQTVTQTDRYCANRQIAFKKHAGTVRISNDGEQQSSASEEQSTSTFSVFPFPSA